MFWLVIRPKKNPARKCYKNKEARLLPFHRVGLKTMKAMLACIYVHPAKTWQVSLVEISQTQQEEMRWYGWGDMKVTLDFWCPIRRSFGTDFQSSDLGPHVATSMSGWFSCCEAWDTETQVTNTSALEWSVVGGGDEDPVVIQVALHMAPPAPLCCVQAPSQPPLLGSSQSWVQGIARWRFPWHVFVGSSYP